MYKTFEDLTALYQRYGKDKEISSAARRGFTNKPIGSEHYMTVLHSFINVCNWFLKAMAIADSKLVHY